MTDRAAAEAWFTGYREAWESNEPDDIRALFAADAVYRRRPEDPEAWTGADGIVEKWLENRDEPGETDFEWRLLAVDGDLAIARCVTTYHDDPPVTYDNLFVVRLTPEGRATEFTDWWIERKGQGPE